MNRRVLNNLKKPHNTQIPKIITNQFPKNPIPNISGSLMLIDGNPIDDPYGNESREITMIEGVEQA